MDQKLSISEFTLPRSHRSSTRAMIVGSLLCTLAALSLPASAAPSDGTNIPADGTPLPKGVMKAPAAVSQCLACHGPTGISQIPEWPNLAVQSKEYLNTQLSDFKSGKRVHPMMQPAIAAVTKEQIPVIAAWFSAQAPSTPKPQVTTAKAAHPMAATCAACHDTAAMPANPHLRGQKAPYMIEQLQAFKKGTRKSDTMTPMVQALSDQDITDLAVHFSQLAPVTAGPDSSKSK